jgi:hypothetical protein
MLRACLWLEAVSGMWAEAFGCVHRQAAPGSAVGGQRWVAAQVGNRRSGVHGWLETSRVVLEQ